MDPCNYTGRIPRRSAIGSSRAAAQPQPTGASGDGTPPPSTQTSVVVDPGKLHLAIHLVSLDEEDGRKL